jgi:surface antigen
VTPIQTYYAATGQPCREYAVSGLIGVRHEQIVGTACRQSDGSWRTVN